MNTSDRDEFTYLAAEASALGLTATLPLVRRTAVATPDGRVAALQWGEQPARLVLLHGIGLNAHTWDATVLAADRPALAIDLPGHGDSEWRADRHYAPQVIAAALTAAVKQLASPGVVLVGHSLGGLAAAVIAGSSPGLVDKLVLIDIVPLPPRIATSNQASDFLSGPADFDSREQIVQRALTFGFGPNREGISRAVHLNTRIRPDGRVVWKHHFGNLAGRVADIGDQDALWSLLEGSTVPVQLIWGSRGFLDQELVDQFLDRVPGSSAVQVDAGHNIQEEAPQHLADLIVLR